MLFTEALADSFGDGDKRPLMRLYQRLQSDQALIKALGDTPEQGVVRLQELLKLWINVEPVFIGFRILDLFQTWAHIALGLPPTTSQSK